MGRVFIIKKSAQIALGRKQPSASLQRRSERRAIVDFVIDNRCLVTIDQINERFGYDCRSKVQSLIQVGWLELVNEPKEEEQEEVAA